MSVLTDRSRCNESLPEQKVEQILLRNDIILTTPSLGTLPLMILPNKASVTTPYRLAPSINRLQKRLKPKSDYS